MKFDTRYELSNPALSESIRASYWHALRVTGAAVVFTGITLGVGVFTWVFSPLQLQADMGVLLTFMFFVNMLGAILLLPAIAAYILKEKPGALDTPQIEH